ncbi:hypothetical protein Tco_0653391 [Tanacetum coccineum]|uniref:Uncharacterized protein n=1 Tax=Tanacetum coccineum TaxID=301880 RepID=A0ABQ4X089_9ASTR
MKREGRQHGVVRTYPILPSPLSQKRNLRNTVDSAVVTGLFTKVSKKPTNKSKFTGKCGTARCNECHIHPATKAKDKAKGTMKLRSIEGSDPEMTSCCAGASATRALAYLAGERSYDDHDFDYDYDYDYDCNVEYGIGLASIVTQEIITGEGENEDESTGYLDVGLCWGEGDEFRDDGWYLVGHNSP